MILISKFYRFPKDKPGVITMSLARDWACENRIEEWVYYADWDLYGRRAGLIRNQQMLDEGKPTEALAFHPDRNVKSGTGDMVSRLKKAGIPVQWFTE